MNRNLPMDTNKNRYEKPVQTPFWGAEVANPNSITFEQKVKTTAAEVCWNLSGMSEPSRCQDTAVTTEGAGTGATTNERDRSIDCIKRSTNSMDMESEQNEKPSYGGDTRQLVSETSRILRKVRFDCPWTDCVVERKSDDISSVVIQRDDTEVEFNKLTICESVGQWMVRR